MFNKRKPRNRRKNKVRQNCRASVLFTCPPHVREIQFLDMLLNFLTSMSGIECQGRVFDGSNISQIAMSCAVLLKSRLGSLQWDRKDLREKFMLIKHISPLAPSVKLSTIVTHNAFCVLVTQKRSGARPGMAPATPLNPLGHSSASPAELCLLLYMHRRFKAVLTQKQPQVTNYRR